TLTTDAGAVVPGVVSYSGVSAVFRPLSNLANSTHYNVTIKGGLNGVKDLAGNPLAADFKIGWTTAVAPDTTAPTVIRTIHTNGQINVPVNTTDGATFSEAMDPLTITNLNFFLKATATGTLVPSTLSYSGVTATIIPLTSLAPSTNYTVTVKGGGNGVKDLAGNPLANDFVISWTTGVIPDTTAPTVIGNIHTNGQTNVAVNTAVGAIFSEAMDPLSVTNLTFVLATDTGVVVPGTISYSGVNVVFRPLVILAGNTHYNVTVVGGVAGVKDLAGNPMLNDFKLGWTTGAAPDIVAPTVIATSPAANAGAVSPTAILSATFSEPMDPTTITSANITLVCDGAPFTGIGSYDANGAVATEALPAQSFPLGGTCTATISTAVKDLAGNAMANPYSWTFSMLAGQTTTTTTVAGTTTTTLGPLAIDLGVAAPFAVLGSSTVSNAASVTTVTGDLGIATKTSASITGFIAGPGVVNGTIYASDIPSIGNTTSSLARAALGTAYQSAKTKGTSAPYTTVSGDLGGMTLYSGVYHSTGTLKIQSGSLTLDAQGNCNAYWIIDMESTLTTIAGAGGNVILAGNCENTKNIWWRVGSSATLGGAIFYGNILADTSISVGTVAVAVTGRLLASAVNDGAVTFDAHTHTVTKP
ncbi:MAG: Ig-like domain-containing protein, partial [Sterolibacterium sp.]